MAAATIDSIEPERAAALVLKQFEGDSFAALERRLQRNQYLPEALEYEQPADVPDGTTFWRAFDALTNDELQNCLHDLTSEVLERSGSDDETRVLTVDGTHVAAWANTREGIADG